MKMRSIRDKLHTIPEKDKIVYINALGAFAVKGGALIVSLLTMPAYIRFFQDQQVLGVWFTVLSVLSWILNFDLGIGNGLRNKLSASFARRDYAEAKEYIASAYWMIGIVAAILSVVGWIAIPYGNWNNLFNVSPQIIPIHVLISVVQFAYLGILLQFFLRLISSILYAMQKSAVNNLLSLVTSVLQLGFVLCAPHSTPHENLILFSIAHIITVNFPLLLVTIVVFRGPLKCCCPSVHAVRKKRSAAILSLGGIFFACQLLYMVIANTNEFFITRYTSPEYVVEYQVYNRLFNLGSTVFALALTPVWSAVSKSVAEEDYNWLASLNKKVLTLSGLAALAEFAIIPFLQVIVNVWLGETSIKINYGYAVCFAMFGSSMVLQSAVSTIGNGMGRMKVQAICYTVGVLFKFIFIHVGVLLTGSWIVIVLANVVVLLPYCVIQQLDIGRYIGKKTQSQIGS